MTVWRKKYSYCLPDYGYIYSTCLLHKKRRHCLHPILWHWVVACCQIPKISYNPHTTIDPPLSAWPPSGYLQWPLNGGYIDCSIEVHNKLVSSLIGTLLYFWNKHIMGALLLDRAAFMCNSFLQLFLDFNKGQVWSPNRQMQYKSLTIEKYRVKIKTGPTGNQVLVLFFRPLYSNKYPLYSNIWQDPKVVHQCGSIGSTNILILMK